MKAINRQAKKVMDVLTAGLEKIGDNKKIGNTEEIFPQIRTECVSVCNRKPVFSLTLHYKQNDSTIRTEDMEFIKGGDDEYYPTSFRQNAPIILRQPVIVGVEGVIAYSEEQQATLASFANAWMKNIKEQQGL